MEYFKLFANCFPVKGYSRSTICDVHRGKVYFVPNDIVDFFSQEKISLSSINQHIEYKKWSQIFLESEIGFITKTPELFPAVNLQWDTPEIINNAIVEADLLSLSSFIKVLQQLNALYVKHVEIRFYHKIRPDIFEVLPDILKQGSIRSAFVYIPYEVNSMCIIDDLISKSNQLMYILVHSSPVSKDQSSEKEEKTVGEEERIIHLPYCTEQ